MSKARLIWLVLGLLIFTMSTAIARDKPDRKKKAEAEKTIHWVFVNYKQFQIEGLIGNLTSCAYRATKPGDTLVLEDGDRIQVTAARKGDAIDIQVRVNEARLPEFSADMMEKGVEEAITQCFTRLTNEGDERVFHPNN